MTQSGARSLRLQGARRCPEVYTLENGKRAACQRPILGGYLHLDHSWSKRTPDGAKYGIEWRTEAMGRVR